MEERPRTSFELKKEVKLRRSSKLVAASQFKRLWSQEIRVTPSGSTFDCSQLWDGLVIQSELSVFHWICTGKGAEAESI
ncbi:hypothetical protein BT69DRAFT_1290620 [Atractiella rhizophila]|nr:hypothetical protein BT69DRAFT_1290620 [Atractiella rhizophila]